MASKSKALEIEQGWEPEGEPTVIRDDENEISFRAVVADLGRGRLITTVPEGWRPKKRVSAQCEAEGYNVVRVDVLPDGRVLMYDKVPFRVSLAAITYVAADEEPAPKAAGK